MNAMSLDLHRITLGALIIALGLLVDDAIIAVEMMVVKMEQGWDRVRAASFAWESTAFPMLTGTLVTAAGFLPDRLRQFGGRRICRRHLLDRGDRAGRVLVRRGDLHALYRRQAAAEHHGPPQPRSARDLRDADLSRPARRGAVVRRPPHHGGAGDRRRVRARRSSASATCSSSSSRCRSGPNCSCSCACRKAPPSTSREKSVKQAEALLEGRQGHRDLHRLCRPGLAALLARPQPAAAERGLRRDRDRRPRTSRRASGSRRGSRRRSPTAR